MNWKTLDVTIASRVATVTLNRPKVHNAFNETAIKELEHSFRMFGEREEVRVIVLAASGTTFCAGADLTWIKRMGDQPYEQNFADASGLADMLRAVYSCPKPVIARIQGDAYGGGTGLVAAADIAVAVDSAHFGFTEVKLGLIPATVSPYVLRAIGAHNARRYFLTGERIDATEAARIGLLHEVTSVDLLGSKVESLANTIVRNGPQAVAKCKKLIADLDFLSEKVSLDTAERFARIRASAEAREGIQAFLEKRLPDWAPRENQEPSRHENAMPPTSP
jgi:methylglutaconyl-CoA hydratase